MDKSDMH